MKFTTTLPGSGNKAGIKVPEDIVNALGAGRRPPVVVTINGKSAPHPPHSRRAS
ncbi:hypothetical protein ACQCSU_11630 [Pseudarthrobacter sp. O4]|uniref:hypothetical protein n=1 Tax=Pseudarthrobacter sp. O4 TaxID=3418417 RepID=UPI003CF63290